MSIATSLFRMSCCVDVLVVVSYWLSRVSVSTTYFPGLAVPLLLLGVGAGMAFITLTGRGIAGVP